MHFVFPRLAVPNSPFSGTPVASPGLAPSRHPRPHVSFDNEVRVQHVSEDYVVTLYRTAALLPEGPGITLDEHTALLPPPVSARARLRMARARQAREQETRYPRIPAAVTGAGIGTFMTTGYWTITTLANGGTSPISAPAVCALLAGGAAFGGFVGLFTSIQDRADLAFAHLNIYEV